MAGFDNEMAEILESFIAETREILETLSHDLLELEKTPTNSELQNTIFRSVHTIKGTSSFLGFEQITSLSHVFEDVLNKIRRSELVVTSSIMDVMFEAFDFLKELLQKIVDHDDTPLALDEVKAKLSAISKGEAIPVSKPAAPAAEPAPAKPAPEPAVEATSAAQAVSQPEPAAEESDGGDDEGEQAEVLQVQTGTKASAPGAKAAEQKTQTVHDAPQGAAAAKAAEATLRVDVSRLDNLMNLVGELVLGRNRLSQIAFHVNEEYESLKFAKELLETSSQIDLITTELQMGVMKTRMVPIGKVFNKIPRLVRDLSKDLGKEIDLQMFGEETELDKSIIEELNDPLVHIIRNAGDHGIEKAEKRIAAGKPAKGTVILKAEHEGNNIVITIEDDGKGMDPEALKRKAMEKGLISESEAQEMSARDAFNLIFLPGFSTAEKVTNVSGRGVGMDVVRTNISKLKGIVNIESEPGKGSRFIIKLPLTLAIIQGLLVQVSKEVFAIPLSSVLEVVRVRLTDIKTVNGAEVIKLRDSVLPLARISTIFNVASNGKASEWTYIVVVGLADQKAGVIVDSLIGQKEVVIKSLGGYLSNIPGIAGSTILGDGRVIMIIDIGQFMALCVNGAAVEQAAEA